MQCNKVLVWNSMKNTNNRISEVGMYYVSVL